MSEKTYSNPRTEAIFNNWPMGSGKRGIAHFQIEKGKKGERAIRTTADSDTGKSFAPKKLTFAKRARIVDGSDGKTYIAEDTGHGFFSIMRGDMKYEEETVFPTIGGGPLTPAVANPRFEMVQNLFLPGATLFEESTEIFSN